MPELGRIEVDVETDMQPCRMMGDQPAGPRVAVVGFQGFGNVGDEAILRGIEALIGPQVSVQTVFTGGLQPVAAFILAERRRTFRHLPTLSAWRALRRVDALLISGGGLVNDYWATVIPRYVAWCLAARLAGRPVIWIGAGVGPIRRRPWRWLAGLGFLASRLVLVRDETSADWVRRCHRGAQVSVIPDPALFQDPPVLDASVAASADFGIVARGPTPRDAARGPALAKALAAVAIDQQAQGRCPELISLHPGEDRPFVALVQADVLAGGGRELPETWTDPDPDSVMADLGRFRIMLTVRLHGLILGGLMGVPSVAVAYDRKVAEAAHALGLGDYVVPIEDVTPATLADAVARLASDGERPAAVRAAVEAIRARRTTVAARIVEAVSR